MCFFTNWVTQRSLSQMFCSHQEEKNVSERTHVHINPASGLAETREGLQDEARVSRQEQTLYTLSYYY